MTTPNSRLNLVAKASLICGVLGILLPISGAIGTRIEVWSFSTGLQMTPFGLMLSLVGLILGIVALIGLRRLGQRLVLSAHGAGVSLLVSLYLGSAVLMVFTVPPIHNISTDIDNPPAFTAAAELRGESDNPLAYDVKVNGPLQRQAYPEVRPLVMALARNELHGRVKRVLTEMGMEVTRDDPIAGEIEAVATTFWFGFKDDLVVRLRDVEDGTRMDLRSVSRVGMSDLGANAERILEVTKQVQAS